MKTCWEAIQEVFENEQGVLTTDEVIRRVYAKYPTRPWKKNTISHHLVGMSVNHPSSRHHPHSRGHAMLFSLGSGRYRRWNPERDGTWVVTDTGVQLIDEGIDAVVAEEEDDLDGANSGISLSLERDLEAALVSNLEQLEPGLRLYDRDGITGYQFDAGVVGRLDILAIDASSNYVVVELKAGEADERACAQILRYMGWVKRELAEGGSVRGIIVAHRFHERAYYVVEATPSFSLMRYEVHFEFVAA